MRCLVVAIVVALTCHADADPNEDAALVHLDRGIAAFNSKDWTAAYKEFGAAHDLMPDKANPYRWLALTEIQLGDCTDALPHIEGFLARVPPTDPRIAEMTRWRQFCSRPAPAPAPAQPAATPPKKALHERWWFWPLVGGAALAVTGTVVFVATDANEAVLPAIHCGTAGCKP